RPPLSSVSFFFFFLSPPPPSSPLFPYTTLFRSDVFDKGRRTGLLRGALRKILRKAGLRRRAAAQILGKTAVRRGLRRNAQVLREDRKSTRLNSSHVSISYAVFCLKKKKHQRCSD